MEKADTTTAVALMMIALSSLRANGEKAITLVSVDHAAGLLEVCYVPTLQIFSIAISVKEK